MQKLNKFIEREDPFIVSNFRIIHCLNNIQDEEYEVDGVEGNQYN
jgi:hypothetical protein